jgi:WD40 repeat protein
MPPRADQAGDGPPTEVFVSYSPSDERWAAWIAWQLEVAGFRTLLRAWDLPPGSPVEDFAERGMRGAAVIVAVLSRAYLGSGGVAAERQVALRTDATRLVTVRVDDGDGAPHSMRTVDLTGVADARSATRALLARMAEVVGTRTDRVALPGAPPAGGRPRGGAGRHAPIAPPGYPPATTRSAEGVSLLHVAGPRFGRGLADPDEPVTARDLQDRILAEITELTDAGVPAPDLLVVSGDVTESGRPRQLDEARAFLTGLRVTLGLDPGRLVIVPGARDVSRSACEAYFHTCEARERTPVEPYFPKLELWAELFAELYDGLDGPVFDHAQPWTLFAVPELQVAIAALNSTMAVTHRHGDDYGRIGEAQASWFAERLRHFEETGWLRVGVVRHDPIPGASGAEDPATLRDATTLDRLLGHRLNVLLHGPGPGGTSAELLGDRLPVLPGAGPGRAEVVHLTAAGLRRYASRGARPGEPFEAPIERPWRAAEGTFTPALPAPTPEPPAIGPGTDPHTLLLQRMADVCVARDPDARVRRVDTTPPQLLVTRHTDGLTLQRRLGAHVGAVTAEAVEEFLRHDPTDGDELVYQGPPPAEAVRRLAVRRRLRLRSFTEFQGMLDLAEYVAAQTARLRADPVYPPGLYVPQRYRDLRSEDRAVGEDLAAELLDVLMADEGRFVLVLGDFGRGKSFVLREVARRLGEAESGPIPILIDLGVMDRSHSVDGLVAAHLAQHGEDRIDLRAFRYMLDEGRVALLFDGFDELVTRISYDRAADHLQNLLEAAQGKAKVVVAARTQHFRTHEQVFTALGAQVGLIGHRRILAVEEFTAAQVRAYFVNRHGGDEQAANRRFQLLAGIEDLLELAQNPRMLGFVADLDMERVAAAVAHRNTISAAGLYEGILSSWMAHESRRASGGPGAAPGLDTATLWTALTALAVALWEADATWLRPAQLVEVADTLTGLSADALSQQQRVHAVGSGSLLVRTEEGLFGFIHPSVTEWLVANAIAGEFNAGVAQPAALGRRPLRQQAVDFLCDIADPGVVRAWADVVLRNGDAGQHLTANARALRARLDAPAASDMRGASLRGADLSYRDLADVDLTGADLTEANLAEANLTNAELRNARLDGARLDGARLVGADLSGADLTRARLRRADLTGAVVTDSRWTRAALIDVTGVPEAPELAGAAIAPGTPVGTELAPATIGVRHGFHAGLGRLPQVLAYGPDGGTLAVGGDDGGVLVCGTVSGRPLRTLQGHTGRVFAVVHGRDVLVTGSSDETVRLWDPATGQMRHVLAGHREWAWPVVLGPGQDVVATGDAEGVVRLWDVATGNLRYRTPAGGGFVFGIAFHAGVVAAAHRDGVVRFWDAATGAAAGEVRVADGAVHRLVSTGDLLVAAGAGGRLSGWDTADRVPVVELAGHTDDVLAVDAHPGEPLLASGDAAGHVRIWDTATGEVRHVLEGHLGAVYCVAWSPRGDLLASGDSAGTVCLWDAATGRLRHRLTGHTGSVWPFAFRPDGGQLAVSDDQLTTRLWDPASGACVHTMSGHGRRVGGVRFSGTGALLATSGNDGVVRLWNPTVGRQVRTIAGEPNRLWTAEFSPAQPVLAAADNEGLLRLVDADTGQLERYLQIETAPLWALAFSPSGAEIATADDDDMVRVWHRRTGRPVYTLTGHRGRVRAIAYSPDGSTLATGCDDSRVRLWDAASGRLIQTLEGHTDRVYALAFGRGALACASWDATARLWDPATGRCRHVLTRHTGRLWAAAFDPTGQLLATAGDDLVIRLWDPATGDHLQTLAGHTHSVASLAFHPRGHLLASGSADGTAQLWTIARGQAARHLTLLGLPAGWAVLSPDGRYKTDGDVGGQFWHVIGMCRFEPGDLDEYLPEIRVLPPDAPF